jgi:hypothetical protein
VFNGLCLSRLATGPQNCGSTLNQFGDPIKAAATLASKPETPAELKDSAPDGTIAGFDLNAEDTQPLLDYFFGEQGGGQ